MGWTAEEQVGCAGGEAAWHICLLLLFLVDSLFLQFAEEYSQRLVRDSEPFKCPVIQSKNVLFSSIFKSAGHCLCSRGRGGEKTREQSSLTEVIAGSREISPEFDLSH